MPVRPSLRSCMGANRTCSGAVPCSRDGRPRPWHPAGPRCGGACGVRGRQRLHLAQRRPSGDREGVRLGCQHGPVGDQRLCGRVLRDDRDRRAAGGHVRPASALLRRGRDLRVLLGPRRRRPGGLVADRLPRPDGDRRSDHVAGRSRHGLRRAPRRQGGARRRPDHRRGRLRQLRRAIARRRPDGCTQLALDPFHQPSDRSDRLFRGLAGYPRGSRDRARAHRLPGHRDDQHRAHCIAGGARPGHGLGLGRPPQPRPARGLRADARRLRGTRAARRVLGADPARRHGQRRLPRRVPGHGTDVGRVLRLAPVPASVSPEDPWLDPARGRGRTAAADGGLRGHLVRRG